MKKVLFLTSTRADFGKLKPLMRALEQEEGFEVHIFVTGMHMFPKYGSTWDEVRKCGFKNIQYYINQRSNDSMDVILANTVNGMGNTLKLLKPDMIVVHGDRVEALAGAISGALNNFLVAHIEGGEVSGTIDESIRHSVSKLAHVHFVANGEAKKRLMRMGEDTSNIYIIGSPDIDLMISESLPALEEAKRYYDVPFEKEYALFVYHPITTNLHNLFNDFRQVMDAIHDSKKDYIMVYPNNDPGCDIIIEELELRRNNPHFRIFPSLRFEYFLVFLKNCEFIIGNSSAGIREAPIYSVPSINIGNRQNNRFLYKTIINVRENKAEILKTIEQIRALKKGSSYHFGDGKSAECFIKILKKPDIWNITVQKYFIDNE
ncbi:MAG: UDP-N-acetylglucosamine 2-epimerase [Candidatus Omnitrophica bacterium]|nr:UDP-N-acetylglucosamine 2-epimerase [Candidatus Omnitrophota bacterium]